MIKTKAYDAAGKLSPSTPQIHLNHFIPPSTLFVLAVHQAGRLWAQSMSRLKSYRGMIFILFACKQLQSVIRNWVACGNAENTRKQHPAPAFSIHRRHNNTFSCTFKAKKQESMFATLSTHQYRYNYVTFQMGLMLEWGSQIHHLDVSTGHSR